MVPGRSLSHPTRKLGSTVRVYASNPLSTNRRAQRFRCECLYFSHNPFHSVEHLCGIARGQGTSKW
eukprot:920214-Amphidinium_carterae.1